MVQCNYKYRYPTSQVKVYNQLRHMYTTHIDILTRKKNNTSKNNNKIMEKSKFKTKSNKIKLS